MQFSLPVQIYSAPTCLQQVAYTVSGTLQIDTNMSVCYMCRALRIDYAMKGLTFLEAGNISLSNTFFSYQFFISDPLLVHGGVSLDTHWIV